MAMPIRLHIDRLTWDAWNREHLAKHQVLPEEAEEVVAAEPAVRATDKGRFQPIGPTLAGRMLTVIVGPVPTQTGASYVLSARPASRKERHYDEQQKGGSNP